MTNFLKILRCTFLLTLAVGQGIVDNAPVEGQWIINNNGETTEEAVSAEDILITLPFSASNRTKGASVYESDCVTELITTTTLDATSATVSTTTATSDADDGFIQFNTTLNVIINDFNGTKYYEPFTDGTRGGSILLCVETFLSINDRADLGNDDTYQKVNFTNNILNISVSLTSDFQVGSVNVEREQVDTESVETDYSEFISAFLCNPADQQIITAPEPYNQGEEITVCAEDTAYIDIVQVEEFNNLLVSQDGNTPYNFVKNTLHNPEITTLTCVDNGSSKGRRVCYAKFVALPRFFAEAVPNELTISGSVFVIRDGARVRRSLRMALPAPEENNAENALAVSGRRAQAEDEEGTGDFAVTASLGSATADSAAPGLTAAVAGLVSVAVGAAGEALMA